MMRTAAPFALITALAAPLAASESPIRDVRLAAELGIGTQSHYRFDGGSGEPLAGEVDDTPLRLSIGYVRGFGKIDHGPIAGIHLVYGRGGGDFADGSSLIDEVETTSLALDVELGYAYRLAAAPEFHLEGAFFAGYVRQQHDIVIASGGYLSVGGHGSETGARISLLHALDDGWQVGATVRYLFESDVEARRNGEGGDTRYLTDGLHVGVSLGYRL